MRIVNERFCPNYSFHTCRLKFCEHSYQKVRIRFSRPQTPTFSLTSGEALGPDSGSGGDDDWMSSAERGMDEGRGRQTVVVESHVDAHPCSCSPDSDREESPLGSDQDRDRALHLDSLVVIVIVVVAAHRTLHLVRLPVLLFGQHSPSSQQIS